MRQVLRGYNKDRNGNLVLTGKTPVPYSKDTLSKITAGQKRFG